MWCDREGGDSGEGEGGRGRKGEGGREGGGGSHFRTWAVIFIGGHVVSECGRLFSYMGTLFLYAGGPF